MRFANLSDFQAHLDALGLFHMDLTLDRVRFFLKAWGGPRPPFVLAHVLGTNGKGSTSAFLAALAEAHGLRTGLFTSPHFLDPRERVRLDGGLISEAAWLAAANAVWDLASQAGLTYFEYLTGLALVAFASNRVDLAIMEAGLGGRFDAVSALTTDLTLYTPIGLDHEKILGPTVQAIARDKAGAMRPGGQALSADQDPEALAALTAVALARGTRLSLARDLWTWEGQDLVPAPDLGLPRLTGVRLGLAGGHQRENARLALAGWTFLAREQGWPVRDEACLQGLARAFVPGRMQHVPGRPSLILDGAHNAQALTALKAALDQAAIKPQAVVFACLKDKTLDPMIPLVLSLTEGPVLVPGLPLPERAWPAGDLARLLGPRARPAADVHEALASLASLEDLEGPVLVCGSLYLLAEFYTRRTDLLHPGAEAYGPRKDLNP